MSIQNFIFYLVQNQPKYQKVILPDIIRQFKINIANISYDAESFRLYESFLMSIFHREIEEFLEEEYRMLLGRLSHMEVLNMDDFYNSPEGIEIVRRFKAEDHSLINELLDIIEFRYRIEIDEGVVSEILKMENKWKSIFRRD